MDILGSQKRTSAGRQWSGREFSFWCANKVAADKRKKTNNVVAVQKLHLELTHLLRCFLLNPTGTVEL